MGRTLSRGRSALTAPTVPNALNAPNALTVPTVLIRSLRPARSAQRARTGRADRAVRPGRLAWNLGVCAAGTAWPSRPITTAGPGRRTTVVGLEPWDLPMHIYGEPKAIQDFSNLPTHSFGGTRPGQHFSNHPTHTFGELKLARIVAIFLHTLFGCRTPGVGLFHR